MSKSKLIKETTMSLLHISKKIGIATLLAVSVATSLNAASSSCDKRAFNIKVNDVVTLNEMLTQLSDMCKFSVVAKDAVAAEELKKELQGVGIKDLSLREIFDLLISENNLSYDFSNNVLKISALQTKTFKVDYITSVREATAVTKASVDSDPIEMGNEGNSESKQDNLISAKEKFDFWEKISDEVTSILNNGTEKYVAIAPIINQNAGLVTVTGMKSQIARVDAYINKMKKRLERQVSLDVSIVAVELSNSYTTGIDWSKFQLGFNTYLNGDPSTPTSYSFGNRNKVGQVTSLPKFEDIKDKNGNIIGSRPTSLGTWDYKEKSMGSVKASDSNGVWAIGANLNFNIDGMINFLETKGKTKIISSPKVTTMNNQPAIISVGDVINYRIQENTTSGGQTDAGTTSVTYTNYSTFIGILLNILPEISDDNRIMLRVNPSLSDFKYQADREATAQLDRVMAPDTIQKKISSVVWVDDGDTVILGGLIGQNKGKDNKNVPFLSDIPLIGNLFKSTADRLTTTELVFVITPRIIDNTDTKVSDSLKELGFSKSLYTNE